ncbi:uncharacterized protein [Leptinotarsa decemlineata]|uniref:uncharacterized protein n=1 Tax=Leptinotarsa decemlineata TaxID=7539 RepID=UPI003D3085F4
MANLLPSCDFLLAAGDININLLTHDRRSQLLTDFINSFDLYQVIEKPTRITAHSQSLIDIVLVSDKERILDVDVYDIQGISDHMSVMCKINASVSSRRVKMVSFRDYRNFDFDLFRLDVLNIQWDLIYQFDNVDCMVSFLNDNILNLFEKHAPSQTKRVTKPPAPWLTYNIKMMIALKNRALSKYKKSFSIADWNSYKAGHTRNGIHDR